MKRAIFSLYIDVPEKEHFGNDLDRILPHSIKRANETRANFKKHYNRLVDCKVKYCNHIGVDFKMFEYDNDYQDYHNFFVNNYPVINGYEVVNFYKIKKLCDLAKEYDEILYLDFDAVPLTKLNFFDKWNLSDGICVKNNDKEIRHHKPLLELRQSTRSPTAKYYNAQAMLLHSNRSPKNNVINTGIIGATKEDINKLDFFGDFDKTMKLMTMLREEKDSMYPKNIQDLFRYDNETIFSYKVKLNEVTIQWLNEDWHYFFTNQKFIPDTTKIVHAVNKDFDTVWRFCEKNNL